MMADLGVGYALLLARNLNLEHKFSPEFAAYWDRITALQRVRAAQRAQGPGTFT
jgi:hypothetical protein